MPLVTTNNVRKAVSPGVACAQSLMGFIGAFGTGPTTFWLPSGAAHVAV